jgi:hypothetical protein
VEVEAAVLVAVQIVGTVGPKKENRRNAFVRVQWLTGVVWSTLLLAGWCLFLNEGSCDAEWDDVMPEAARCDDCESVPHKVVYGGKRQYAFGDDM